MSTATIILSSGRCAWGECVFCGYGRIIGSAAEAGTLVSKFTEFFDSLADDVDEIKVFGSGSFLDEKQVPKEAREKFLGLCSGKNIRKIIFESRPEFVTENALAGFHGFDYTIAIGLEVANNDRLEYIKKGFKVEDYERAAKLIHKNGGKARTYVLVNIPEAGDVKREVDESIKHALRFSDSVVAINLLPHGNTPLMNLWVSGQWSYLTKQEFLDLMDGWENNQKVEFDEETFRFTPRFPKQMRENLAGVGEKYLTHPHFEVWQDYLIRWYKPPEGKHLLFLPCSKTKPYIRSDTHKKIAEVLKDAGVRSVVHETMLSNAGVIPREFEDKYPFNAYDWDERGETPEVKQRYIEVTSERISDYLSAHKKYYHKVGCYLKYDSESYIALAKACCENKVGLTNLLSEKVYGEIKNEGRPLQSAAALNDLKKNIGEWLPRNSS